MFGIFQNYEIKPLKDWTPKSKYKIGATPIGRIHLPCSNMEEAAFLSKLTRVLTRTAHVTRKLCDLRQVTCLLCASVSSLANGKVTVLHRSLAKAAVTG